ncbi:MAG: hypothetical protein DWQ44_06240 [Bacteroidetes bacterium]|nr:MAG: hypothetical protein DWQ33_13170 [Bacteroidota bacterium]REK03390.1 MAG: hypothetical protein DWQ39_09280 [Bacteroidota bacterium]REK34498.1 MAG: hypothetical protein DWQ44_06240 [Bacteroidota bacterium]REK50384.1 MAG: hypothetical protein DWQ48_03430 [Bacteroidota bacterium]
MKSLGQLSLIFTFFLLLFSACKKDEGTSPSNDPGNIIQSGQWRISLFMEDGNDETSHFSGYVFTFSSDGSAKAEKSGSRVNGSWSKGTDNSTPKLNLHFGNNDPWRELNEDWHILEENSSIIRLEHVSGGNGGIDNLNFTKI